MRVGINTALMASGGGYRQTGVSRYIGELVGALEPLVGPRDSLSACSPRPGRCGTRHRDASRGSRPCCRSAPGVTARRAAQPGQHHPAGLAGAERRDGPRPRVPAPPRARHHPEEGLADRRDPAERPWSGPGRSPSPGARQTTCVVWSGIDPDRVTVVHQAASPRIRTISAESVATFRERHGLDRPYVLAVGTLEPRKNLPLLLTAFARIVHDVPHDLVLVGPEGWLNGELRRTVQRLGLDRLRMTGFVPDEELGSGTPPPTCSRSPPSTKASGSHRWRPCTAGRLSWPRTPRASPRWSATPGSCSHRTTSRLGRPRCATCSATRSSEAAERARPDPRGDLHLGPGGRRDVRRLPHHSPMTSGPPVVPGIWRLTLGTARRARD